jgi:hypothetical protein
VERSEDASCSAGEPQLGEQGDTPTGIPRNRRPVAADEPPALGPRVFSHGRKQFVGLGISKRQQRQLFTSVERGDDTRRPAAQLSRARVEKNRTHDVCGAGRRAFCHHKEPNRQLRDA